MNKERESYVERYRNLAMKYNFLPADAILVSEWGCANNTLSSVRDLLRKDGFGFKNDGRNKGFTVTERPPKEDPQEPIAAAPQDGIEIAINSLTMMVAEMVELQRETVELTRALLARWA